MGVSVWGVSVLSVEDLEVKVLWWVFRVGGAWYLVPKRLWLGVGGLVFERTAHEDPQTPNQTPETSAEVSG